MTDDKIKFPKNEKKQPLTFRENLTKKSSYIKFNNIFPSVEENLKLKRTDFSGDPKKISQYIKSEMKMQ